MTDDRHRFLTLVHQPPARVNCEQAAWILNCQAHDIPILVGARLLKPLGNPQPNSVKYFATRDLLELSRDRAWLARMTSTVSQHWRRKNQRKAGFGKAGAGQSDFPDLLSSPPPPASGSPERASRAARTPPGPAG